MDALVMNVTNLLTRDGKKSKEDNSILGQKQLFLHHDIASTYYTCVYLILLFFIHRLWLGYD